MIHAGESTCLGSVREAKFLRNWPIPDPKPDFRSFVDRA